jgi:abortive infection bacteriophage resistance protein
MPVGGVAVPDQYRKQALTFRQQLDLLTSRGLQVGNDSEALRQLASISYYRLSGYWYPFRVRTRQDQITDYLAPGTAFEHIVFLYEFDRRLRSLVLDAIERVEIAVRTQITYCFGHTYGAFGHTDSANFHPNFRHADWLAKLEDETRRSSDEFIRHYKNKYDGFPTVPIWMLTEVISFGALSFFYKGLRNDLKAGIRDKSDIADYFNLHHKQLGDWLHTLTYVRNVCAHHSRLWNRKLAIRPDKSKDPTWLPPITPRNDRIFYILLMLRHLQKCSGNGDNWAREVANLLEPMAADGYYRNAMGIPADWKEHSIWR